MLKKFGTIKYYRRPIAISLVIFGILLVAWLYIGNWYRARLLADARAEINIQVANYGNQIATAVSQKLGMLDSLTTFIQLHIGEEDLEHDFSLFAKSIVVSESNIRLVQVYSVDSATMVYPLEGNEAILGRSFSSLYNDERLYVREAVQRAIETRQVTLNDPYPLLQGGLGLVARKAIYKGDQLWGLAVIIIDIPPMLQSAGFSEVRSNLALSIRDHSGQDFAGDPSVWDHNPVTSRIVLPEGEWTIAGYPRNSWQDIIQMRWVVFESAGGAFMILLSALMFILTAYQTNLRLTIQQQTEKLHEELRENQEAVAAMRESEEKFRSLAENSQDYIMRYDRAFRHIYMNPAGLNLCGMREEEIIGKTHRESGFEEALSILWEHSIEQVFQTGQPYGKEFELESANGPVYLDWRLSPEFDETGQVRSVLGVSRDITHQKKLEKAIHEDEERFRLLYQNMPVGYQSLNSEGCLIEVNEAWLSLLGYQREEVIGKWFGDFLAWEWVELFRQRFPMYKSVGAIKGVEFEVLCKDGRRLTAAFDGLISRTLEGDFKQTHCILQDITTRKRAEVTLRESEERLRLALKAANQGMYDLHIPTGEIVVSPEYAQMLGYDPLDFHETYPQWKDRLHPEDAGRVIQYFSDYISGLQSEYRTQIRLRTHAGKWLWVLSQGKIVEWDDQGHPVRMLGTHTDISELKRVERDLRESQRQLQHAEAAAHLGHWYYDIHRNRHQWSEELYNIFGLSFDDYPAPSFEQFIAAVHPEDRAYMLQTVDQLSKEGSVNFEYRVLQPGGQTRFVNGYGKLEVNENGEPLGLFGILLDTTELKQKERELERKNAELENFTYTVSHDLKSPLVTIKSFLGYLEQDIIRGDATRIEQDKQFIRTAVDKMGRLLEEILEISRIGRITNPPVRVTFHEVTQEALALVAGQIADRGVEVNVSERDLILLGDRSRLVQIWQNLLDNAVKFMGNQAHPNIEVGFEGDPATTVFFVKDNGIGIDPRYHGKIFNLFEKLEVGSEGTGMGLALVKRVVVIYYGKIWVESDGTGQGACFRFTLPGAVHTPEQSEKKP